MRKLQLVAAQRARRRRRHADHVRAACNRITRARPPRSPPSSVCAASSSRTEPRRRPPTGNALLDRLLGAEVRYVATRGDAGPAMDAGGQPGCARRAASVRDSAGRIDAARRRGVSRRRSASCSRRLTAPDVIVHATSSGGTQAGSSPGAACTGSRRASSASAPTIRGAIGGGDPADPRGIETLLEVTAGCLRDASRRGRRHVRRRRLRHADTAASTKRRAVRPDAKRCSSTRPIPPRRWPADRAARAGEIAGRRWCSGTQAAGGVFREARSGKAGGGKVETA